MTATILEADAPTRAGQPPTPTPAQGPGVSTIGVLRSEWLKLRSVRSTTTTLAAAAGSMLLFGLLFAAIIGGVLSGGEGDPGNQFANDPTGATLSGAMIAQLIIGVLGVLLITSEYSTGLIRTTLTAVPRRLPVLWAKAAVLSAVTFPIMLVAALAAFLGGQALISSGGLDAASLSDSDVLRAVVGTAAYLTAIAVMGLAIGTLLRSSAAAISTLVGSLFLLPSLATILLPSSVEGILKYLPSQAGTALTSVTASPDLLSPGPAALVVLGWVVVLLGSAAVALKRRSA